MASRPPRPRVAADADSLRATLRFHAASGARVALRNSVFGTMGAVFVLASAPRPPGLFRPLSLGVAAAGTSPWSLALLAMVSVALARQAAPQLSAGQAGWMRSVPSTAAVRRRALVGALVLAQAPLLVFLASACVVVLVTPAAHFSFAKLASCALIVLGAAMAAVPTAPRGMASPAALAGIVAAATGSVPGIPAALLFLVIADRLADAAPNAARPIRVRRHATATLLPYRIAWRAMSWQVVGALVPAALPVGFAWLMCENNRMTGDEAATVMRTAGTLGVVVTLASLASVLQLRRPAWAWARSLPYSAGRRVRDDAMALLLAAVPVWLAVAAVDPRAGLAVAALSPLLALLAAGAMRRASARITGTQGEVIAVGILIVVAVSRSWWLTLACVALTPLALHLATRRERDASATSWSERHHSTSGDALAWTSSG